MTARQPSLRPADVRLLVPGSVRRVRFVGDVARWDAALEPLGLEVTSGHADLAVTDRGHAGDASRDADHVLVDAATVRGLPAAWHVETVLVRHGRNGPRLFVPIRFPRAVAHALTAPVVGRPARKRAATRLAVKALSLGIPAAPALTIGSRTSGLPHLLAMADQVANVTTHEWYLVTGEGDDRQRMVWFCFGAGGAEPAHVVKCGRVPGLSDSFDRDAATLRLLDGLPDEITHHAPRVLGRADVDGLPIAVETAAPGQPLHSLLTTDIVDPVAIVATIANWIIALGAASASDPSNLDLTYLTGLDGDLVAALPPLHPVVQHNDLGCWNIVATRDTFTAIDWESGRAAGLPLWDLVYFLTDALSTMAAPSDDHAKERAMGALLRGELDGSKLLFAHVRDAAHRAGVPLAAVGPIVTLCWLHHARSAGTRDADAGPLSRVAAHWVDDPVLGPTWPAFHAAMR